MISPLIRVVASRFVTHVLAGNLLLPPSSTWTAEGAEGVEGVGDPRTPQSTQSVPMAQTANSEPDPPSSQSPSEGCSHVLLHSDRARVMMLPCCNLCAQDRRLNVQQKHAR